jgi:arylsulfatase A-like enzyme
VASLPASTPALVEQPIVVLVTMDSVRAELLTDPRHARKLPRLAALAEQSVFFTEARTPGSGTVIAFSQIFTGKHTFQLQWGRENKRALPKKDTSPRFPELLAADGVQTVTFASFERLLPSFGIARGFEEAELVPAPTGQDYALSAQMMDAATARVAAHDGGRMFLFMHLMDPHYPYDAASTKGPELSRYVAEAGLCSEAIGRLVDALTEKGLWGRTILIVAADHGEGLNKHGIPRHNIGLYEEIVRVPLLIRVPGVPGRRVDTPVTLLDLGPTILDLYGLPTPGAFMGQSLVPFLRGESPTLTRPIVASALFNANAMYAFPHKVIVDRDKKSVEVFDLVTDPDERENLADEKGGELSGMLEAFIKAHDVGGGPDRR